MSNEEARMNMYKLGVKTKNARKKMLKTLELCSEGRKAEAMQIFAEAENAFEQIKNYHDVLRSESKCDKSLIKEQENTIEFTEIFIDTIRTAAKQPAPSFGAVRFHVYN